MAALKLTTVTFVSKVADRLTVSGLKIAVAKLDEASTRQSTPSPRSSTTAPPPLKSRDDKNNCHRKPVKIRRFTGALLKSKYQKALHILSNVAKNKGAGTVDELIKINEQLLTPGKMAEGQVCRLQPQSVSR